MHLVVYPKSRTDLSEKAGSPQDLGTGAGTTVRIVRTDKLTGAIRVEGEYPRSHDCLKHPGAPGTRADVL
jgi:hypothetical protein